MHILFINHVHGLLLYTIESTVDNIQKPEDKLKIGVSKIFLKHQILNILGFSVHMVFVVTM